MEPRSFNRGDDMLRHSMKVSMHASMEPRSFNRGDDDMSERMAAIERLQWSHGRLTVVTDDGYYFRKYWICFNGATVV